MDDPARRRGWLPDEGPVFETVLPGALEAGPQYLTRRPRGLEEWVLLLTTDGVGEIGGSDGRTVLAPVGTVVALRPRTPQLYGTAAGSDGWSLLWAHLRPPTAWLPLLRWPETVPGVGTLALDPSHAARVEGALARAHSHHRGAFGHAAAFAVNAVEEALLWCAASHPDSAPVDPTVRALVDHVGARLSEPHTVASLAAVLGWSPSHLAHLVARATGEPVMAHVHRLRMDAARDLLAVTDLPVAAVAARVGYPDPLYFSRRFRAHTGLSPTQWRRRRADDRGGHG